MFIPEWLISFFEVTKRSYVDVQLAAGDWILKEASEQDDYNSFPFFLIRAQRGGFQMKTPLPGGSRISVIKQICI